jgi:transcriptional regulator with XRE-family HTH domain
MNPEWFKDRLRELRQAAGLSRNELADKVGGETTGRTIEGLEQGRRLPGWEMILRLSTALGVECSEFTRQPGALPPPRAGRPKKQAGGAPSAPGKTSAADTSKPRIRQRKAKGG